MSRSFITSLTHPLNGDPFSVEVVYHYAEGFPAVPFIDSVYDSSNHDHLLDLSLSEMNRLRSEAMAHEEWLAGMRQGEVG